MELLFLGTSSMVPTKDRNHSSILLSYSGERILVDCGEGTQRQLKLGGIAAPKVTRVLLSHWHGDHVLGLPGLLQTLSSGDAPEKEIQVYGPRGTKTHFDHMMKAFFFEERITVEVHEVYRGVFFESEEFTLEAAPLHHTVPCVGYRFAEKPKRRMKEKVLMQLGIPQGPLWGKLQDGKSIMHNGKAVTPEQATEPVPGRVVTFLFDTGLCKSCTELAKDADVLVCEATYANDLEEKAEAYRHLTGGQAASIASQAGVKKLVLTHFSQRYTTTEQILDDAKTVFPNTLAAQDFMKVKM